MKTFSIATVTVVYNGASILSRHLMALQQQSHKIDEIVVVNNASTDNTLEVLGKSHPGVTVLNLEENRGVGGGLAAGLTYATLQKKYDWVWVFDQDSVPDSDSLERLLNGLQYIDAADKTAILAPLCRDSKTGLTAPGLVWRNGRLRATPANPGTPVIHTDSVISSGSLIRREAIEAVGMPRTDFFMDFVDHEYCFRLRRHGFNVAVVQNSFLDHALGDPSRIRIFNRERCWTDHFPWREYYMTRNEVFTIWKFYPSFITRASTLYRMARHAIEILLFGKQKAACLRMMYEGFRDGRAGRLGVRFLPDSSDEAVCVSRKCDTDFSPQQLQGRGSR